MAPNSSPKDGPAPREPDHGTVVCPDLIGPRILIFTPTDWM
jgi:hypothetical protein